MLKAEAAANRAPKTIRLNADLVVVGGGLSGTCCAITAARAGVRVVLVTDRPVLGGNASSEVRLWVLGATSHLGNNNRWAREGGVIDELLVENMHRNPDSNPLIFDSILLEKVVEEPNLTLLLNTAVFETGSSDLWSEGVGTETPPAPPPTRGRSYLSSVVGFCSQNSTRYELAAPLFCDASGDGIVGFLAGAAFRMGAEAADEFGEKFAPTREYGELLGHSMYFYTKDVGRPVRYVAPKFALDVTQTVPRFRSFNAQEFGCKLWWIEYGGRLDTVHDTEQIKWELWKVVYGVWDYIKNSGQFPEAETLTLEWVGTIPGKRESRRFEGDFILTQPDVVEQRPHYDDVAFGGWSIDLHPADGVFSEKPGCNQWHSKGIFGLPYRCFYSKNVPNLFFAGRIISASHVAFGSTRVMATGAHGGQAVGMAAKLCLENGWLPRDLAAPERVKVLQQELLKTGQHIPGLRLHDPQDLAHSARITASSEFVLSELREDTEPRPMEFSVGQLLPLGAGKVPKFIVHPYASEATKLDVELRLCSRPDSHTPDVLAEAQTIPLNAGRNCIHLEFNTVLEKPVYAFLIFRKNERVSFRYANRRVTGVLSVFNLVNPAVSNFGKQEPTEDIGVDAFEFWCPQRRPAGQNLALYVEPGLRCFSPETVRNGVQRPTHQPNAWVADPGDPAPRLTLEWPEPRTISRLDLGFDTDFDHPMETVLMQHPEANMPFCVRQYRIFDEVGNLLFEETANHQTRRTVRFAEPVLTRKLVLEVAHPSADVPAAVMEVRAYE